MIEERIAAGRCSRCRRVVVPPVAYCPDDGAVVRGETVSGAGEIVSFTTLHSPPEGFRSPLHIALVELPEGGRLFCHGDETRGMKIGSQVAVEAVNSVYYFSHLGFADRARLFWRRAGDRGEKVAAISKSMVKRIWKGRSRAEG